MARTSITVASETAMEFRAVRLEMSRSGGTMLSVDEVLRRLMACWRERDALVGVHEAPKAVAPAPVQEGRERPARRRGAAKSAPSGPPQERGRVAPVPPRPRMCSHPGTRSVGGYCNECDHLIGPGGYWK